MGTPFFNNLPPSCSLTISMGGKGGVLPSAGCPAPPQQHQPFPSGLSSSSVSTSGSNCLHLSFSRLRHTSVESCLQTLSALPRLPSTPRFTTIWLLHSTEITLLNVTNSFLPWFQAQRASCGAHFFSPCDRGRYRSFFLIIFSSLGL